MTDKELLEKLREMESLIVRALYIAYEVRDAIKYGERPEHRRDRREIAELVTNLFKLVEPHVYDGDHSNNEPIIIDVESDYAPRGMLGGFRFRHEVLCGLRKQEKFNSWKFPKV